MPGYDAKTVEPLKAALVCPECNLLLRDAVQTDDGIRLCRTCFTEQTHPQTRARTQQGCKTFFIDRAARREVAEIVIRCDYCEIWSGKQRNLQAHLRNGCPNFLHPCPNEGCEMVLSPARMNDHLKYCQYRRVACDWCHDEMAINLLGGHMLYCGGHIGMQDVLRSHSAEYGPPLHAGLIIEEQPPLQQPIQEQGNPNAGEELPHPVPIQEQGIVPPNLGEELPYPIQEQDTGEPAAQVPGPRPLHPQNIDRLRQRLLEQYGLQEDPRHQLGLLPLQLTCDLTVEISGLRHQVAQLTLQVHVTPYNRTLLWRIEDVARKRRDAVQQRGRPLYSLPFYTGRNGYKMCIRAYLNGDGSGHTTHLSLFFVLMKGEYDALLKWPFDYKVSMILVDQNCRKHLVQTINPTPESSSFQRPQTDMNVASGCPQFAKLSVLDDEDYVKENVMYIKCIVDTSRIFHP